VAFSAFFGVSFCDVLVGIVHLRFAPPSSHAVERWAAVSAPIMAIACGRVLGATRQTPPAALYFGVRQKADAMGIVRSSGFPLGRLLLGLTTPDGGSAGGLVANSTRPSDREAVQSGHVGRSGKD
jgi:hypothetical protein